MSSIRNESKTEQNPGPGNYNVSNEYQKEKIIATNLKMDIKIVEIPKPNGVFKSMSKRFDDTNLGRLPGPGHYNPEENINKISYKYTEQKNSDNILFDEFRKQASVGKIPSIPTAQQLLGYSENDSFFYNFHFFLS